MGALDGSASRGFEMSESETSETAMPGSPPFKPELHSWILIPDSDSFKKQVEGETTPEDPDASAATASEEPTDASCVTAESIILGSAADDVTACSSPVTSPEAPSEKTPLPLEVLTPTWPLALPRPWIGSLDGTNFMDADSTTDDESDCGQQLASWGRPLAVITALLASHFGVLMLGYYIGRHQGSADLTCLARRFSSNAMPSSYSRLCAA